MKKIFCILFFIPLCFLVKAQDKDYDTTALIILDRMCAVIGDLSSCTYVLNTSTDTGDTGTVTTTFSKDEVYMVGPDKMMVNVVNEKGHKGYWYNGSQMNYYSFTENNYATIEAPPTIVEAMDSVHKAYGIDFPAADFFYPTFADDLLDYSSVVDYLGTTTINGKSCFHILAKGKDMNIQIWVANDATNLPQKLLISYSNNKKNVLRYEATFSDWQLNPDLPNAMFEFSPPPNANQVFLMPENFNDNTNTSK